MKVVVTVESENDREHVESFTDEIRAALEGILGLPQWVPDIEFDVRVEG